MSIELVLSFSDTNELTVTFEGESSSPIAFQNSIAAAELQDVRWYLETYGAQYTADVDLCLHGLCEVGNAFKNMELSLRSDD